MRSPILVTAILFSLLTAGCIRSDYVGREFAPIPESERIEWFRERAEIPVGEYRIVGRLSLRAIDGTDSYDIRDYLTDKAREKGADAICLIRSIRVKTGLFDREDSENIAPGAPRPLDPANVEFAEIRETREAADREQRQKKYGKSFVLSSNEPGRTEVVVNALFLKRKAALGDSGVHDEEIESLSVSPVDPAAGKNEVKAPAVERAAEEPVPPAEEAQTKEEPQSAE